MKGYYKAEITASVLMRKVLKREIWDSMTMMVLTITGRVKDQFKTDKGKYISQHH
jgi:long-subunit acyl-CoA synthetase (AMP-forming)